MNRLATLFHVHGSACLSMDQLVGMQSLESGASAVVAVFMILSFAPGHRRRPLPRQNTNQEEPALLIEI